MSSELLPGRTTGLLRRKVLLSRCLGAALPLLIISGLLGFGIVRHRPYANDVTVANSRGDDWLKYKLNAESILRDGLLIARVPGPYQQPGGFLYNYFVAAVFAIAGPSAAYVYVVQYGLLGLCASLMYAVARRHLSVLLAAAYLLLCTAVLLSSFDDWVTRLLSENLVVALYALALVLFLKAIRCPGLAGATLCGLVCGLTILCRMNLVGIPLVLAPLFLWIRDTRSRRLLLMAAFLGTALLVASLLPLRNLVVAGVWGGSVKASILPRGSMAEIGDVVVTRALFCVGIFRGGTDMVGPGFALNKRWLLLNASACMAVLYLLAVRRFRLVDAACGLMIVAAYGPFILMPLMGGYGMRFQYPYAPLLLLLVFRAVQELFTRGGVVEKALSESTRRAG